ncbi:MAG TPA: MurR/RpiR family transcriptional regulator, partial [Erysipelotrichaceae bacterium]|nr:MurR/RpiR family transcriptional regulator [Erysipelotrichaceae bacterium]
VEEQKEFCDEIVLVPSLQHLNQGNLISPQFPILVLIDMLYASLMEMDRGRKRFLHEQTLHIITGS